MQREDLPLAGDCAHTDWRSEFQRAREQCNAEIYILTQAGQDLFSISACASTLLPFA